MSRPRTVDRVAGGPCRYPAMTPLSAYTSGCRCDECVIIWQAYGRRRAASVGQHGARAVDAACIVCAEPCRVRPSGYGAPIPLCREHKAIRSLVLTWRRAHGVTNADLSKLLADPTCWICRGDLTWRMTQANGDGRIVLDHDHRCCPGRDRRTCGRCIRGLAHDRCNRRLGALDALVLDIGAARVHELIDGAP